MSLLILAFINCLNSLQSCTEKYGRKKQANFFMQLPSTKEWKIGSGCDFCSMNLFLFPSHTTNFLSSVSVEKKMQTIV